ncbi:2-phospho-L-lactate transferase [Sphingosinicella soli]|uniref:LPPG:FO 2-phospho-L-lactate transferase n=1 Tax=Sphingosinicella soli TaxID=333708 RepID=A0A7W7B0T9_9SPHN|nr:2-phospho-L-lactate transferase [Sphingosinicella soli]MBB4631944.1 LPPG:FO 2-phospho-L-lactate transferase [Sphingosinicella soli]
MILALAGGVGGARLANGLAHAVAPGRLTVAVNVGDDFTHLGLAICPDIDTVIYTLAGCNNRDVGWGVDGETWAFMDALNALGGPGWFNLGDRDLAKHVLRTERLRQGATLSQVTADFAECYGIRQHIVPMSDDPVRSVLETDEGELSFQDYFVRRRCEPRYRGIRFDGADSARMAPGLAEAFADPSLEAIVICPSNPILSIGPFLAVEAIHGALISRRVPCIAVSPFIAGETVKGPAAKIMRELGLVPGAASLASAYAGLVDIILCDLDDPAAGRRVHGLSFVASDTLMRDLLEQERLAHDVLNLALSIGSRT